MKIMRKITTVLSACLLLSNSIYAKIELVEQQHPKIKLEPVINIESINDGLKDIKFNINSSRWEGTIGKYELIQNLPVQFITEDRVVYTIRLKDIVSYKCRSGNSKLMITIKGSEFQNYGTIDRVIDDPETIRLIINLFETQRELILSQF